MIGPIVVIVIICIIAVVLVYVYVRKGRSRKLESNGTAITNGQRARDSAGDGMKIYENKSLFVLSYFSIICFTFSR